MLDLGIFNYPNDFYLFPDFITFLRHQIAQKVMKSGRSLRWSTTACRGTMKVSFVL